MNNLTIYISAAFVALSLITGAFFYGNHSGFKSGYQEADNKAKTIQMAYDQEVIKLKQQNQEQVNGITKDYQQKMESIKTETEHTISTLNSSNQRLRIQITRSKSTGTCSTTGTSGQQSDEYAELSKGSSEFLISQAIKADQWIIHLQQVINVLTKENSDLKK